MKVSQQIEAGNLTASYVSSWSEKIELYFGDDKVEFSYDEQQLRSLTKRLNERIAQYDSERAEELANQIAEAKAKEEAFSEEEIADE
jgi:hypothetical protein|tara:strand:- start:395 stop:655 length:261 start_codon:yes stop_codon:yes gene_type:complete